jgi:predicted NBD/HSP70 family sugar kinase
MLKLTPEQMPSKRSFKPAVDILHQIREAAPAGAEVLTIALERDRGYVSRYDLPLPTRNQSAPEIIFLAERIVKFMLWSSGGWRVMLSGPPKVCQAIKSAYSPNGARKFDCRFMSRVYGCKTIVERLPFNEIPQGHERALMMDRNIGGNRLGFELNVDDVKVCAVRNGREIFSAEFSWEPSAQRDPEYHYSRINAVLQMAASHLRRVDAIGGSTPGIVVDNRIKAATIFRAVPESNFDAARDIFIRLADEWQLPVEVANNGDIAALSGLIDMGRKGVLGIRFGNSEAGGYIDNRGCLTGRLNELAFAPVDLHPSAPRDEWSGDIGVGSQYFSQPAVNRIALKKGIHFPAKMPLDQRIVRIQEKMLEGDSAALNVFQQIGLYLGYTIPWYREFYDCNHFMILGGVTAGLGGVLMQETARLILHDRFPELAEQVDVLTQVEKIRKSGQAFAAATLPLLRKE